MLTSNPWPSVTLADLTENVDSERLPVRRPDRRPGPYPYYGASGVIDQVDGFTHEGLHILVAEDGENLRTRKTPVAFIANGKFWVNNHAHALRARPTVDARYVLSALLNTDISGYLTGSTQPKLTQAALARIRIPAPPYPTQKDIGSLLGAVDDKIELNNRTAATLEGLMHATYTRKWRTDDVSVSVGDVVECRRDPIDPHQVGPDTVYVGLEHITPHSINLERHGFAGDVGSGKVAFQPRDILFGRLRPYFHKVAVANASGIASQEVLVLRPKSPELLGLAICEVSHPALIEHASAVSTGTRMPRVSWSDVAAFRFGHRGSAAEITDSVRPLLDLMQSYTRQNELLAQLRGLLLPKLMSGEIRLQEAEKAVSRAL